MTDQFKKVTLATIGNGAAAEVFQRELESVLKNIADVNTSATEARKITLTVILKPAESRDICAVSVKCASSTPGVKPVSATFFMGRESGKVVAFENNPRQEVLPFGKPKTALAEGEIANA